MILIEKADELAGKIEIIYNPLSDLGLALDLLHHPEHHKVHHSWYRDVLGAFSHKEKKLLEYFGGKLEGYLNLDFHIDYLNAPYEIPLRSAVCSEYIRNKKNWHSTLSSSEQDKLAAFLIFIWESYIFPVVNEHRSEITIQFNFGNKLLEEMGALEFLQKINDRIAPSKNGVLKIEKWVQSAFSAEIIQKFYIELSLFGFPHMIISDRHEEGCFYLSWDLPFQNDNLIKSGINRISQKAFALSDKSRLRILLMLSEEPMTQKDITALMGFAKSTISRHINILIDAGIIVPEDGEGERNVLLSLNRKTMDSFSKELIDWLGK
ncbi:MAG: winged helix-turn-helix transcriptional regulator [Spirochaetales bacterium]|nr:winged helix-turn-helix transcriptional regulator [Spirochaetales bacterium]